MLEGLDQIPWSELETGPGTAQRIPELIRQITSPTTRGMAERLLLDYLNHQGTIYEASAYVVPFLFELLNDPTVPQKKRLLYILSGVTPDIGEFWHQVDFSKLKAWEHQSRQAFIDGFPTILSFFDDDNPLTRKAAIKHFIVPNLYPDATNRLVAQKLLAVLTVEKDDNVKLMAVEVLGNVVWVSRDILEDIIDDCVKVLREIWKERHHKNDLMATQTAGSLAKIQREHTPADLYEFLVKNTRAKQTDVIEALWDLDSDRYLHAFEEGLNNAPNPKAARQLAGYLLNWVFVRERLPLVYERENQEPDGTIRYVYRFKKPLAAEDLTEEQKQALPIILDAENLWIEPHNLLEVFGLPANPDETRAMLS